ncbi:MAG TPA: hypothetical protein DCL60_08925 [Armatimonadetes bacterium]|jgi:SpoVK/Ycf46/Vps4 family AAA+-type ATPase|nr:hypothetical protein [Armatimonadota bacterium]
MLVFFSEYTNCGYIRENPFYPVPVFVVAAANNISQLPPELLHKGRFDEIFFVDLPDRAEREDILKIHITKRGRKPEAFDLKTLAEASEGFSGAEIEEALSRRSSTHLTSGRI